MKKFDRSHLWISLISFCLGVLFCFMTGMFQWAHFLLPSLKTGLALKNIFHPPAKSEPGHNMQDAFEDLMSEDSLLGGFAKEFDMNDIHSREDDHFFYLEIPMHGMKMENFSAKVENGQILLEGEIKQSKNDENNTLQFQSSFRRQFPAPTNIDPAGIQIEQKKDMIVLQFPKKP